MLYKTFMTFMLFFFIFYYCFFYFVVPAPCCQKTLFNFDFGQRLCGRLLGGSSVGGDSGDSGVGVGGACGGGAGTGGAGAGVISGCVRGRLKGPRKRRKKIMQIRRRSLVFVPLTGNHSRAQIIHMYRIPPPPPPPPNAPPPPLPPPPPRSLMRAQGPRLQMKSNPP